VKLFDKKIGVAMTGSFCTYEKIWQELSNLVAEGAKVRTVFSYNAQTLDSRFGKAEDFLKKAEEITGQSPITTIVQAEPIGPKGLFDIMVIAPCTGNTLAKLATGITDSPVLMAAKSHLRNNRPVVICLSSNDSLSMNLKNVGLLMNTKNIYFVPFGQDNCVGKPNSMVAHTELIIKTLEEALEGKQIQPVIDSPISESFAR
jgi:dipicolinate synthase subunit B